MHDNGKGRAFFDRPGEFEGSLKAAYIATEIDPVRFSRTYDVWTELVGQMPLEHRSIPTRQVGELSRVVEFLTRHPSKVRQYYTKLFDIVTSPEGIQRNKEATEAIISDMRTARRGLRSLEPKPQSLHPNKQSQNKKQPTGRGLKPVLPR